MANDKSAAYVQEFMHKKDDIVTEVEYVYEEIKDGKKRHERIHVKRENFERLSAELKKTSLSFEDFMIVVRPFFLGEEATKNIPEAFNLLDADQSGTIDIAELALFMPAIIPGSNQYMMLRYFQAADKNKDYKLSFEEFTDFIKKGYVRDLALKRL